MEKVLVGPKHNRMDFSTMTRAWWQKEIKNALSKLLGTCNVCQYESRPWLNNIQRGQGFGCICNGQVPYTTEEMYNHMMKTVLVGPKHERMDFSTMTRAWWEDNVTGNTSQLLGTCNVCQYESRPTISNIQQGRGFGCFCNGGVPCTTREYYDYMMEKVLVGPKHNRMDFSTMTRAWWQKEIKNAVSKLLGTCTVCDHESRPSLNDIQQGQGFGCECTGGLTEKFVYKVLRDSSSLHIDCHGQDKRLRIPGEKPCKRMVDFWAAGPTHIHVYAAVELDGGQHFGPCRIFDHEESWRGDREKQARLVKLGGRLCRVEQEWVYDNMNEPWMPFVLRRLSAIVASTAPGTLVTLDVHAARYAVLHAPHWEECGGSVSAPVSLADLKKEFAASRGLIENRD
jgi:hypothetical protein